MDKNDALKLESQLCFAIYACSRKLTRMYRPLLEQLDITYPQYLVLIVLWEKKHQTVTELGERLLLDTGTLTPLLKRMEVHGLVQRCRSKKDERKVIVKITQKGDQLKEKAYEIPGKMFCQSGLSIEKFYSLKGDLENLLNRISEQEKQINNNN